MERNKSYSIEKIIKEFESLTCGKKCKVLTEALKLATTGRAGTQDYAIAKSMGYIYQDDGSYTK